MTFGLSAATVAGVVGAGATLASTVIGANAAGDATKAQLGAVNQARTDLLPYQQAGLNALAPLQNYVGLMPGGGFNPNAPGVAPFSAATFQASPGYQWQLGQGIDAINNRATRGAGVNSGNTMRALEQYATGLAGQDYYRAADLYQSGQQNTLRALMGLTGAGQNAAAGLGGYALQGGNAAAAGQIAQGQILGNALNNPSLQSFFTNMLPSGSSSATSGIDPAMMSAYNLNAAYGLPY